MPEPRPVPEQPAPHRRRRFRVVANNDGLSAPHRWDKWWAPPWVRFGIVVLGTIVLWMVIAFLSWQAILYLR